MEKSDGATMLKIQQTRRSTLRDVAAAVGVSVSAASMALADHPRIGPETKRLVAQAVRRLGYRTPRARRAAAAADAASTNDISAIAAPAAPAARSLRFGYLLLGGRENDIYHVILRALIAAARNARARIEVSLIADVSDPAAVLAQALDFAEELDGVIVSDYVGAELLEALGERNVPTVVFGHVLERTSPHAPRASRGKWQVVAPDDLAMGRLAVRQLAGRSPRNGAGGVGGGHRRIAFVCEITPPGLSHARWLAGYRLGLIDAGLPLDPALVQVPQRAHAGTESATDALLRLDLPPTAFVVPDLRIASLLIESLRKRRRRVAIENFVVGGYAELAAQYGLAGVPLLCPDLDASAALAVRTLAQLADVSTVTAAAAAPIEMLVPFKALNLADRFPSSTI